MGFSENSYQYATVSVAGTVNVTGNPVMVHTVNITDVATGKLLTLCDGTTATSATVGIFDADTTGSYLLDAELGNGIKIVTDGDVKACVTFKEI